MQTLRYFVRIFILFVIYYVTARLGLTMNAVSGFATLIWPPTGISLVALFFWGKQYWPGVALGAVLVNWSVGATFPIALGIGLGNTLEALAGVWLLSHVIHFRSSLDRLQDVVGLILLAAGFSTAISAAIGVSILLVGRVIAESSAILTWRAWWLGDMLADLIIAPLFFTWLHRHMIKRPLKKRLEWILLNVLLILISFAVFRDSIVSVYPLAFLIFPVLIWISIRFGPRETTLGVFILSAIATWGTSEGLGPFVGASLSDRLLLLQSFMGVVAITALVLSAVVAERTHAVNRAEFLSQISIILASSIDYEKTLKAVSQLAVPDLADWCMVDILADGHIHRLAVGYVDSAKESLADQLKKFPPDLSAPGGIAKVVRTQQPVIENFVSKDRRQKLRSLEAGMDLSGELISARDPEHLKMVGKLGLKSYLSVPLCTRERVLGALTFVSVRSLNRYGKDELKVAQEIARRAAIAIDNSKLYQEVQEGLRIRDEFISIASHELRTPLTPLRMQIHLIKRLLLQMVLGPYDSIKDQLFKLLDSSDQQIGRLGNLIENMLNVSRIAAGQLILNKTEIDLLQLVREVVERFDLQIAAAKCQLEIDAQSEVKGNWDAVRIEEVIINLLTNAMKYGAGKPIKIQISSCREWAEIAIQDHGVGISPEDQKRIFKRFERASSMRSVGGLGLGLYITHELIQAHGGSIEVRSEIGKGSTFIVRLPLVSEGEKAETA